MSSAAAANGKLTMAMIAMSVWYMSVQLPSWPRWPKALCLQEIRHGAVERGRVLDAAGVTGIGDHHVAGAWNERGGLGAALQRHVVGAVDHQHRRFHPGEAIAHVAGLAGAEDLRDAAARQFLRVLGEEIEHPLAEQRVAEPRRHQLADMPALVALEI